MIKTTKDLEKKSEYCELKTQLSFFTERPDRKPIVNSGFLAEHYCHLLWNLDWPRKNKHGKNYHNNTGYDLINKKTGQTVQVKHRANNQTSIETKSHKPSFDVLYDVKLDPGTLLPTEIWEINKPRWHKMPSGKYRMDYGKNCKRKKIFKK